MRGSNKRRKKKTAGIRQVRGTFKALNAVIDMVRKIKTLKVKSRKEKEVAHDGTVRPTLKDQSSPKRGKART